MAAERGSMLGFEQTIAYDSASSDSAPTWADMVRVQDVTQTDTKGQADVSRRESDVMLWAGGQKDKSIEFDYVVRPGDPAVDTILTALQGSYESNTPMHLALLNGPSTPPSGSSSYGVELWAVVFDLTRNEALSEGVTYSVVMKPTDVYDGGALLVPKPITITTP